jgi:hypothetical protein
VMAVDRMLTIIPDDLRRSNRRQKKRREAAVVWCTPSCGAIVVERQRGHLEYTKETHNGTYENYIQVL